MLQDNEYLASSAVFHKAPFIRTRKKKDDAFLLTNPPRECVIPHANPAKFPRGTTIRSKSITLVSQSNTSYCVVSTYNLFPPHHRSTTSSGRTKIPWSEHRRRVRTKTRRAAFHPHTVEIKPCGLSDASFGCG
jgi:hypothetical protein